jgi:hypothetical protein
MERLISRRRGIITAPGRAQARRIAMLIAWAKTPFDLMHIIPGDDTSR